MNFLSLGLRTHKAATRAQERAEAVLKEWHDDNERLQRWQYKPDDPRAGPEKPKEGAQAYKEVLEMELERLEKAFDIGLTYYEMAKRKMGKEPGDRWYMLTVRPPPGTNIRTLVHTTEQFVCAWEAGWEEYEYVYEQKGETEEDMGLGCHMHMLIRTAKANYYPSHILRDAKKAWSYVAANCIQVDGTLQNVPRAKEYIRGIKNHADKEASALIDPIWRERVGLQQIYDSGQVHTALVKKSEG